MSRVTIAQGLSELDPMTSNQHVVARRTEQRPQSCCGQNARSWRRKAGARAKASAFPVIVFNRLNGSLETAYRDLIADLKRLRQQQNDAGQEILEDVAKCEPYGQTTNAERVDQVLVWNDGATTGSATSAPVSTMAHCGSRPMISPMFEARP
jgi:hypothetical protein